MQIKRKQTREVSGTAVLDIEFDDGSRLEMLASLSDPEQQRLIERHIRLSHRASPSTPADTPLAEKMAFPIGLPDQPASG
ncbi:MAG: hypothetical protein EBQ88_02240 [Betaproteobacteria bacterium]|nr:hypothetical protein [Betaproteobacteria bacterium]